MNGFGTDRSGRIVARADWHGANVSTPEGTFRIEPLDDCRSVAVSPDGKWLATGSHATSRGCRCGASPTGSRWPSCPSITARGSPSAPTGRFDDGG